MNYFQPLVLKRHEVMIQELRNERKKEAQHLQEMKAALLTKLRSTPAKREGIRAI